MAASGAPRDQMSYFASGYTPYLSQTGTAVVSAYKKASTAIGTKIITTGETSGDPPPDTTATGSRPTDPKKVKTDDDTA